MDAAVTNAVPNTATLFGWPLAALRDFAVPVAWIGIGLAALGLLPFFETDVARFVDFVLALGAISYGAARLWHQMGRGSRAHRTLSAQVVELVLGDPAASLLAAKGGAIMRINAAAKTLLGEAAAKEPLKLASCLARFTANPAALIARLEARALATGSAVDDVTTREAVLRVSVQSMPGGIMLWRFDDIGAKAGPGARADALSLPMLTANKAGVVLYCNAALRKLTGGRPKTLHDLSAQTHWRSGEELLITTATGPQLVLLIEFAGTGERREIYLAPLPGDVAQSGDIRAGFEKIPVALMTFAATGEMRDANAAARDLMGGLLDGKPAFHDMFDALGRPVSDWLADVAEARLPSDAQVLRLNKPGGAAHDFVHVSLRRMVENARPLVLAVIQDATALKTLEAQFTQSQKMQAIGQLAGGVAHDFNNLLTAISGNCDLLLLRHTGDDPSFPDLMQIRQNANRAAALVAQLLAFSRKQALQPEYLDLQDVFSDLAHLLNRLVGEKLHLALHNNGDIGTIRADRRQLEQVIVNLVVNARDAMPHGGTISITTEAVHLDRDLQRDRASVPMGDYARISVADTGTGMPPDLLPKIFEPFFTTKKAGEGTGLGLSTAYGIVKQSGGFIFVDSEMGQGTTFTLYFPIHANPDIGRASTSANTDPKPAVIRQGEGVVLLVEDELPVRAFAARALRLRGYTVLEASSGEEALALLSGGGVQVDLFISDVIMPGMDGPTWVRAAQADFPDVPVIFVSGYAEDVMTEHQQRIAHSTFLAKPFSLAQLTVAVQDKLRLHQDATSAHDL